MCVGPFATIIAQLGASATAGTTAAGVSAAGAAAGGITGTALSASGQALTLSAQASLTQALSSAAFLTTTAGSLMQFVQMQEQSKDMAKAANKQFQAEQAQVAELARQEKVRFAVENDQLYRKASLGFAKRKTAQAAQGLAGADPRAVTFALQASEASGIESEMLKMRLSSLQERATQSTITAQTAFDTARSAFSPEAYLGLGLDISSNFLSATHAFGAMPFESSESYGRRLGLFSEEGVKEPSWAKQSDIDVMGSDVARAQARAKRDRLMARQQMELFQIRSTFGYPEGFELGLP